MKDLAVNHKDDEPSTWLGLGGIVVFFTLVIGFVFILVVREFALVMLALMFAIWRQS